MVRECRPPAREPGRAWLARRSTMATSTRANASSPANISPVGPPPAITTACLAEVGLGAISGSPAVNRVDVQHALGVLQETALALRVVKSAATNAMQRLMSTAGDDQLIDSGLGQAADG